MGIELKNLVMNDRQICDLELLLNGAFQPLTGFMDESNYNSVLNNMRLSSESYGQFQ